LTTEGLKGLANALSNAIAREVRFAIALGSLNVPSATVSPAAMSVVLSTSPFLSPQLVDAILQGRQPVDLTATRRTELDLPLEWTEQHRLLAS